MTSLGSDFILGLFDLMALGVEEKFEKQIHLKSVELALVRKRLVLIEGINTAVLAVTINFACLCSCACRYSFIYRKEDRFKQFYNAGYFIHCCL